MVNNKELAVIIAEMMTEITPHGIHVEVTDMYSPQINFCMRDRVKGSIVFPKDEFIVFNKLHVRKQVPIGDPNSLEKLIAITEELIFSRFR